MPRKQLQPYGPPSNVAGATVKLQAKARSSTGHRARAPQERASNIGRGSFGLQWASSFRAGGSARKDLNFDQRTVEFQSCMVYESRVVCLFSEFN